MRTTRTRSRMMASPTIKSAMHPVCGIVNSLLAHLCKNADPRPVVLASSMLGALGDRVRWVLASGTLVECEAVKGD
jgi:hypothetical protein